MKPNQIEERRMKEREKVRWNERRDERAKKLYNSDYKSVCLSLNVGSDWKVK